MPRFLAAEADGNDCPEKSYQWLEDLQLDRLMAGRTKNTESEVLKK